MELLKQFGFKKIKVIHPDLDESKLAKDTSIQKLVVTLSYLKAQAAQKKLKTFHGYIISGILKCSDVKKFSRRLIQKNR